MTLVAADAVDVVHRATLVLDAGELVVVPTDTAYALAADALVEEAVERVFEVLRRPADEALPVCVGGAEDLHHVAFATPLARDLAARFWPGPLTLVLRARPWLPDALTGGQDTVAVRVPSHPFALELARRFGPYTAGAAEHHGAPAPATAEQARAALGSSVRLYVDGGALPGVPSTVVDATGDEPRVLREGAIASSRLGP